MSRRRPPAAAVHDGLRLCHLSKWPNFDGYGFNLHADKKRQGHFIGQVDPGSPAELGGLRKNDRLLEVNGISVEGESHREIIERIKRDPTQVELLVIDREGDEAFAKRKQKPCSQSESVVRRRTPAHQPGTESQQQAVSDGSSAASGSQRAWDFVSSSSGDAVGKPPPRVKQGKTSKSSNQVNNASTKEMARATVTPGTTKSSTAAQEAKQRPPHEAGTCKPALLKNSGGASEKNRAPDQPTDQGEVNHLDNDQAAVTADAPSQKRHDTQPSRVNRALLDESKGEPRSKTRDSSWTRDGPPSPPRFSYRHQQPSPNDTYGWFPQNDFASAMVDGNAWSFADAQQPWSPFPPRVRLVSFPIRRSGGSLPSAAQPVPPPYPYSTYVPFQARAVYWPRQAPPYAPFSAYYGYPVTACPPPVHPDFAYPSSHSMAPPFAAPTATVPHEQSRDHLGAAAHPSAPADVRAGGQTPAGATANSKNKGAELHPGNSHD
ncbi:hypothetical protein MRX96_044885 [Rhipicephalus microplus]